MKRGSVRSDIPYKDRLLLEKYRTVKEHRDDAARIAMKVACVTRMLWAKIPLVGSAFSS